MTAALVGWGTVLLIGARNAGNAVRDENSPPPVVANVLDHDSQPQEKTEPAVTAKVHSAIVVPALIHDSLPQGDTEPAVTAKVQSATAVPPPRAYDNPAQDNKPLLRAAEISPDQAPKPQLSQSTGSSLIPDTDEIAALVKRGKDFVTNGDLVSARLLLRRAAEAASAEAALALGETFDPLVFQRLHVIGIEPDVASAQKWYQRAAELGSAIASQRLAKPDRTHLSGRRPAYAARPLT